MKNIADDQEFKSLLTVLRALVTSRKQPCFLDDILHDYKDVENQPIPFKEFGFRTVEDLLLQSNEFHITKNLGKVLLAAKKNEKSNHIAKLVSGQKSSKQDSRLSSQPRRFTRPQRQPVQLSSRPLLFQKRSSNVQNRLNTFTSEQQKNFLLNQKYELRNILEKEFQEKLEKEKSAIKEQISNELNALINQLEKKNIEQEKNNETLRLCNASLNAELTELKENSISSISDLMIETNQCWLDDFKEMKNRLMQLNLDANNNQSIDINMSKIVKKEHEVPQECKDAQQQKKETEVKAENEKSRNNATQQTKTKQNSPVKKKIQQQQQHETKKKMLTSPNSKHQHSLRDVTKGTSNVPKNQKDVKPPFTDLRQRLNEIHIQNEKQQQQNPMKRFVPTTLAAPSNEMGFNSYHHQSGKQPLRAILGQSNVKSKHQSVPNNRSNITNKNIIHNNSKMLTNNIQQPYPINTISIQQPMLMQQQQQFCVNQKVLPKLQVGQQQSQLRQYPKLPSVQNRLKLQTINSNTKSINGNIPPKTEYQKSPTKHNVLKTNTNVKSVPPKIYRFDTNLDPCTAIVKYCVARKYGEPKYSVIKLKHGTYDCNLEINSNIIYSTYPLEYATPELARQNCAMKAIEQIQIVEARNLLPEYPNDKEFLDVLYNELLNHPNGMISDKMTDWFIDKFAYRMPDYWFVLVKNSRRFTVENGLKSGTFLIFANSGITVDNDISVEALEPAESVQMESLKLPWSEKYWDLYITHCVSTVEIWAYLVGTEYNVRFTSLMTELDIYMLTHKTRPDVIAPKHIYLVEARSNWHRVRVESLDLENEIALCFYIDFGDRDRVPINELYLCDPQFLRLPPQAVPFSLFGLEDFAGDPNALKELEKHLLHHSVIGDVITKEAEFEANSNIQVIIFDTSTDEDINVNVVLQDEIARVASPPQLKEKGMTVVNVTHIDSISGDVSVQVINAESEYVQRTIKQILQEKFKHEQHKCSIKELTRPQMLLVYDDGRGDGTPQWYRAKVIDIKKVSNIESNQEQMLDVLYIDYNIIRKVHVDKIYRLESLSLALSKFPSQALRIKLHNISEFSPNVIGRMRALLPEQCQAFVRVEKHGNIPEVTILRRVNGPDMPYCSINDDLRMEIERSKDAALCTTTELEATGTSTKSDTLASPTQLFRSLSLNPAATMPLKISELPKLHEYDNIPPLNAVFYVHVSLVSNPQNFTVQPYNEDYGRFQNLMKELQDYCANTEAYIPVDMVEMGQAYAAENVEYFYRVIAKARYGEMVDVFYCDYGDNRTIRSDQLKVLPMKFRQLPKMSINAKLFGIDTHNDEVWSSSEVQRFRELVLGKKLASFVKGITRDDKGRLELTLDLVDVSTDEDINIRDVLLNEGVVKQ